MLADQCCIFKLITLANANNIRNGQLMTTKKIYDEHIIMRYFRERYNDFPKGKLINSESPDFILKVSKKRSIGIEITQIHEIAGSIRNLSQLVSETEKILTKKDNKLSLYKKNKLYAYWLIVSTESLDLSDKTTIEPGLANINFVSGFDKVFLFDLFGGNLFELGLNK